MIANSPNRPAPRESTGVDPQSESQLLARLRAGNEGAYDMLVRQNSGRMLSVARRFLPCQDDSADAVQEAFVRAFQSIHKFEGNCALSTWLHRIVVNACLMKLRTNSRHRTVPIDELLPAFDETGHHVQPVAAWSERAYNRATRSEMQEQVRACINQLPDDYRMILLLRDIEELDTDETAELLNISVPNVKTRLHRARQALRTLLDPIVRHEQ
jgi:RNA polymerase sigma-70 factor, ECF subfamily